MRNALIVFSFLAAVIGLLIAVSAHAQITCEPTPLGTTIQCWDNRPESFGSVNVVPNSYDAFSGSFNVYDNRRPLPGYGTGHHSPTPMPGMSIEELMWLEMY